jgi:ribonuclease PH
MREKRAFDELRPLRVQTDYLDFADGSAYIEIGQTKVIEEKAPPFLKGQGTGWVTAEYAMLPCSTERRSQRERFPGRISGRTQEIQRLIGRSLRAVTDMAALGERTIIIDCDVIQADGGTRVAAVTAGCVAAAMAMKKLLDRDIIDKMPLQHLVAGISVGIVDGRELLDLDYAEDSQASTDMNVIETDSGQLVEVQATAEKAPFSRKDLSSLLRLADKAIQEIIQVQKAALKKKSLLFMAYGR